MVLYMGDKVKGPSALNVSVACGCTEAKSRCYTDRTGTAWTELQEAMHGPYLQALSPPWNDVIHLESRRLAPQSAGVKEHAVSLPGVVVYGNGRLGTRSLGIVLDGSIQDLS